MSSVIPGVNFTEDKTNLIGTPSAGLMAVLVVGTACKGPSDPQFFFSDQLGDIIDMYGPPDPYSYKSPTGDEPVAELTLTRTIIELLNGGPPPAIWIVRVEDSAAVKGIGNGLAIETAVPADDGSFTFTAKYSGQWYNNFQFRVDRGKDLNGAADTGLITFHFKLPSDTFYDSFLDATPTADRRSVYRWYGQTYVIEIGVPGAGSEPTLATILTALQADDVLSKYFNISYTTTAGVRPKDTVGVFKDLFSIVADGWSPDASVGGTNWSSDDSALATSSLIRAALDKAIQKDVRFVLIGGADEGVLSGGYLTEGLAHAKAASTPGNDAERIFYVGTDNYSTEALLVAAIESSPYPMGSERGVQVTPGYKKSNNFFGKQYGELASPDSNESVTLSGGYAAARAVGLYASRAPNEDSLGQTIGPVEFEFELTRGSITRAINKSFTVLARGFGGESTIKRGMTSAGLGDAFEDPIIRLVVDDIRYALRKLYQNFIGEKNIRRKRQIMQEKSISLMGEYIRKDIITDSFNLTVSSTRQQEIDGKVEINANVQPVFSMKFINVNLILG